MKEETVKATIAFADKTQNPAKVEIELDDLDRLIQSETELRIQRISKPVQVGQKGVDLLVALEIINLSLTALGALISILNYWQSQKMNYTITVKKGNADIQLNNISPEQFESILASLQEESPSEEVQILIAE